MANALGRKTSRDSVSPADDAMTPLRPVQSNSVPEEFKKIGILEVVAHDPRPSFVIDLEDIQSNGWRTLYTNDACLSALSDALVLRDDDVAGPFRAWASDTAPDRFAHFRHNGKLWISYELRSRWRIVSGTRLEHDQSTAELDMMQSPPDVDDAGSRSSDWLQISSRDSGRAVNAAEEQNWVDLLPSTPFINDFFKSFNWSASPLGPMENWSYVLRRSTRFLLVDPAAACLFWGDKFCCVFNSGYAEIMGVERQSSMGQPASLVWPEIYASLVPIFAEVRTTRQACCWNNIQFIIERNGLMTETYWDWNLIPLMEDRGVGSGFYSSVYETTPRFLSSRRQESMLAPVHASDTVEFWTKVHASFAKNPWDAPFAVFYDIKSSRRMSQDSDSPDLPLRCILRGSIGVPDGHPFFPSSSDLSPSGGGIMSYLAEAAKSRESLILTSETHAKFFRRLAGIEWAGFGLPSTTVVIFCLRLADEVLGFAVMGLNPRRSYNDGEHRFVDLLDTHLSASISSAALIERSQDNQARLERRLAASLVQAEMSDARYRAITELSPLGMINLTPTGDTMYANRTWYEITGHSPEADLSRVNFRSIIHDDDLALIDSEFDRMVHSKQKRVYEVRLKKQRYDPVTHHWEDRWLLCTGGPEYDDQGNVRSVIGCIAEITAQKQAENLQWRERQAAVEARKAQEKFMDATSHEMRNPLSAVLQSVEDLSSSLKEAKPYTGANADAGADASHEAVLLPRSTLDACVDAVNVIALCAQHQTRIVDDVLTMSKLESHMLEVTPVPAQPLTVVRETMQMYGGELASNKISADLVVEPAYTDLKVDWVYCDPARLKQILINLLSNAIKFTRQEPVRKITINVTASAIKPPAVQTDGIIWFPSLTPDGAERVDLTQNEAWGDGEPLFIGMVVTDTGKGLTESERKRLFNRFAQANTLTHVHYGGSGLGLFISRELTEMQGGSVGVVSTSGRGSAFAFYIKCRRADGLAPTVPRRPSLTFRTPSGQKTAQLAGLIPPRNDDGSAARLEIPPTHGLAPSPPSVSSLSTSPLPPPAELTVTAPTATTTATSSTATAAGPVAGTAATAAVGLDVLVVEDNVVNQRVMAKQLLKAGCTVAIANHGQEALDYLERSARWGANDGNGANVDVALMDIEMPVMNGLVCTRRIREHERDGRLKGHLPLMAVTANARKEQVDECMDAGMDDVTTKPFKVQDLLVKVEKLIAKRKEVMAEQLNKSG